MNPDLFRNYQNWNGSYYELCLELGGSGNDEVLLHALSLLWSQPALQGSWIDRENFGSTYSDVKVVDGTVAPHYGVLTAGGSELGCVAHVVRETGGSDWLDLCVPCGMLELEFSVRYPLYYEPNPWIATLDSVYAEIAASIFSDCTYRLAIIGEETSGITNANSITVRDLERGLFLLPDDLVESLGVKSSACRYCDGLWKVGGAQS